MPSAVRNRIRVDRPRASSRCSDWQNFDRPRARWPALWQYTPSAGLRVPVRGPELRIQAHPDQVTDRQPLDSDRCILAALAPRREHRPPRLRTSVQTGAAAKCEVIRFGHQCSGFGIPTGSGSARPRRSSTDLNHRSVSRAARSAWSSPTSARAPCSNRSNVARASVSPASSASC